jgi:predicted alpha/beta superfamily hydrolase
MSKKLAITVRHPSNTAIVLRTEHDWDRDLEPTRVSAKTGARTFSVPVTTPHLYFKPVMREGSGPIWAQGPNHLAIAGQDRTLVSFPYFKSDTSCSLCALNFIDSKLLSARLQLRVFLPPGYDENTLQRYPVLYMQDGQNLFFPEEASFGADWKLKETLSILSEMNQVGPMIVVGITPHDRMSEYTMPGYELYGRFLVEELKPLIDARYRTMAEPQHTAVMGSSLGGVVSFFLGWQYPEVFGSVGCLSSTFGYRDDLLQRVATERKKPVRVYLDSGYPRDNFEATRAMRAALLDKAFTEGVDLLYFGFPEARHNERSWAMRCHIPLQYFFGRT